MEKGTRDRRGNKQTTEHSQMQKQKLRKDRQSWRKNHLIQPWECWRLTPTMSPWEGVVKRIRNSLSSWATGDPVSKKKNPQNKTNKNKTDTQIPMGHPSQEVTVCPQCLRLFYSLEFWFSNVFSPCSLITHYNRKILVPLETLGVLWGVRMLHSLADSIFVPDIPDDFFVFR